MLYKDWKEGDVVSMEQFGSVFVLLYSSLLVATTVIFSLSGTKNITELGILTECVILLL